MKKSYNGKYTMVVADLGKYLVEKNSKSNAKMVKAIYDGKDIPELEEKRIEE